MNMLLFLLLVLPAIQNNSQYSVRTSVSFFSSPYSFTVQPEGSVYIVNQHTQSLDYYPSIGDIHTSIGGHGWGNYEFDNPTDVASSFLLDVFVTDFNNRRIQRFDKNLNYVQTYDEQTLPSSVGRFQPLACALSTQGDLFVVELDGKRILKFDKRNQLVKEFGTFKDGAGMVTEPKDIAVSQSENVFVLDKSKIIVYDIFGNYLRTVTLPIGEWKNIQVSDSRILATAPDSIALYSLETDQQIILTRSSFIGIPSQEQFVDAAFQGENLIILTTSSLLYCSPK